MKTVEQKCKDIIKREGINLKSPLEIVKQYIQQQDTPH